MEPVNRSRLTTFVARVTTIDAIDLHVKAEGRLGTVNLQVLVRSHVNCLSLSFAKSPNSLSTRKALRPSKRIRLKIKASQADDHFLLLFPWSTWTIQLYVCKEKLDAGFFKGLKG